MDVWFCEGRSHSREATCELRILWQVRCARSHERASGDLCFPLTKTYMDVGKPYLTSARVRRLGADHSVLAVIRTLQHRPRLSNGCVGQTLTNQPGTLLTPQKGS